jgi:glyceraldehyde 3-phosphate dehydrogenase
MTIKIGINGFGRMGRLALRAAWQTKQLEIVQIYDTYIPKRYDLNFVN